MSEEEEKSLGSRLDYTRKERTEETRETLQKTEEEQNLLDGGGSIYTFTTEDAEDYEQSMPEEGPSGHELGDIKGLFEEE